MANQNEALVYGWNPQQLGNTESQTGYAQPGNAQSASTAEQTSAGAPSPVAGNVSQILENPGYASSGIFEIPTSQETGSISLLTATSVQTTTYTATANQIVPCDTTSGSFTVTLPTTPVAGTFVAVKMVTQGSANTVTVATGGSDVLNKTGRRHVNDAEAAEPGRPAGVQRLRNLDDPV